MGIGAVLFGNVEERAMNAEDGLAAFVLFQNPVEKDFKRLDFHGVRHGFSVSTITD